MTAVLIDTSILIDYLRNRQEAVEFLEGKPLPGVAALEDA